MKTARNPEWLLHDNALLSADRLMATIGERLAPGSGTRVSAVDLAAQVGRRLRELPLTHRAALAMRLSLALADLGETVQDLTARRSAIGAELSRLLDHRHAALTYSRRAAAMRDRRH